MARALVDARTTMGFAAFAVCAALAFFSASVVRANNAIPADRSSSPADDLSLKRDAGYPAGTAVYYAVRTSVAEPDAHKVSTFLDVGIEIGPRGVSIIFPTGGKRLISASSNVQVFTDVEKIYVPPGVTGPVIYPGKQPAYIIER